MLDFLGDLRRTHTCGILRGDDAGKKAVLMGWVNRRRDLGNLLFIDIRDRTGVTQIVFDRESNPRLHQKAGELRNEYVIAAIGTVKKRDSNTINKNIPTGEVELIADELRILNEAKQPPFLPGDTVLPNEEMRLKYRYIDLRREALQRNLELRHKIAIAIREYLSSQGFFEIETPFMTRSTPEGARDYLVPSRVQPGSFYALPQSPQLFKQILMISGFDKYFQIVRCFRDEDLRADRQPEFTQIDLEMSYPQPERVWEIVEGFLTSSFKVAGHEIKASFPRMTYDEAIRLYGSDKPDMRLPAMTDVRDAFAPENLQILAVSAKLPVVAIRIPTVGELSRKERDEIKPMFTTKGNAKVFEDFKRLEKNFPEAAAKIRQKTGAVPDDLIVLVAGNGKPAEHKSEGGVKPEVKQHDHAVYTAAGLLRLALAQKYADRHGAFKRTGDPAHDFRFLWVTDFPMFEWDDEGKRWAAAHHPFTSPHEHDMDKLESDPAAVRALAYDCVLNGTELGSGSIRIHRQDIQRKIFHALGMTEDEARSRFGFFLEALEYGTPPHGGIALGLDRIVMILAEADSLREVIPFPKTARAVDLMVDAPTPVSESQLKELGILVVGRDRQERLDLIDAIRDCGRRLIDSLKPALVTQGAQVKFDAYDPLPDEVTGGLFARNFRFMQAFLIDFHMWAQDVGQSLLRMMFETLVYLKFLVTENKAELFLEFKKYGIGQEKLFKMQLRKMLEEGKLKGSDELRSFIDSDSDDEIFDELVSVRLDNFENLRVLAEKTELKDEYVLHYQPYSIAAHGHWPSLRRYYLQACGEPLHKFHLQPNFELPGLDFSLLPKCIEIFSASYDLWILRYGLEDVLTPLIDKYFRELDAAFEAAHRGASG